jgi:hypothetical protein
MVFKRRPYRQSAFLAHADPLSVARAELQQDSVELLPRLKYVASCIGCTIYDDRIEFDAGGVFTLVTGPYLPAERSILSILVDLSKMKVGDRVDYNIGLNNFVGSIVVLPSSDPAYSASGNIIVPVSNFTVQLSAPSRVTLWLRSFRLLTLRTVTNFGFTLPNPTTVISAVTTLFRLPYPPKNVEYTVFYASADGASASVALSEDGVQIASLSTTSTSTVTSNVRRVWRRDTQFGFSKSANALLKGMYINFHNYDSGAGLYRIYTKSLQSSYSTTSTSYVQYTPLSLSTTYAKIRRIVVTASSNAKWYVNVDSNTVLNSAWGITSIDLNPPVEAYKVDLFLASADGANATASIIIIYDEVPARL